MKKVKYRFNRKEGKIYIDRDEKLLEYGSSLKMIVLHASNPIFGGFFNMPPQYWIFITFIDEMGNWSEATLSNGTTNALITWINYQKLIESRNLKLFELITTITFKSMDSDYQCFDYDFSGVIGKPGLGDRMAQLIANSVF